MMHQYCEEAAVVVHKCDDDIDNLSIALIYRLSVPVGP